jgi:hypothetical protein
MILGIFVISLLALKAFSIISVSWTVAIIISAALIAVDISFYFHKKHLLAVIMRVADAADNVIGELEYQIDSKEDRE